MEIELLINEIISFPEKFLSSGNISIYSFLKDIGYFKDFDQVQEDNIAKALIQHPEYINTWFGWSEDKRVTSGWYIQTKEDGDYLVGYSPKNPGHPPTSYPDKTNACAAFIKREIQEVRTRIH